MKQSISTIESVLHRIVEDGIKAAKQSYSKPEQEEKLKGSIDGFNSCVGINIGKDSIVVWFQNHLQEANKLAQEKFGKEDSDYWYWRCRAAEIEWTCNVLSAVFQAQGWPIIVAPTARGFIKAADIIGVSK